MKPISSVSQPLPSLRIGLLGLGTVGRGVVAVLQRNQQEIQARCGRSIDIQRMGVRNLARAAAVPGVSLERCTTDLGSIVTAPDIDVVVEVIGGSTLARELITTAIRHKKHVVTANKALLAEHGNEIFALAREHGVIVAFEAAVAAAVPIVKTLREALAGNRIEWVAGIINGTTNFILTQMQEKGQSFADALAEAQALGYAESDPTFDIEGIDAAHKITLLSAIAFGIPLQFSKAHIEGITALKACDIAYAASLGYCVKLLGIAKRVDHRLPGAPGVELRVHPTLIPKRCLLSHVNGAMNGVMVKSDAAGITLYYGAGAGGEQTASAVIADLVDVARLETAAPEHHVPHLAFYNQSGTSVPLLPLADITTSYYLRIRVQDETGVLAEIARLLAEQGISVNALLQQEADAAMARDLIILTHSTREANIQAALKAISALNSCLHPIVMLRVEELA